MAIKNLAGKRRKLTDGQPPYEIWQDRRNGWNYLVVKKNQAPDKEAANPYAIWNVAAQTPHESDRVGHDAYAVEIKQGARLVWRDPAYQAELDAQGNDRWPYPVATDPDGWKKYLA